MPGKNREKIAFRFFGPSYLVVLSVVCAGQLSKLIVSKNLFLNQSIPVVKNIFHITLVHNRGAAFGILKNQVSLFIFTSLVAFVLIALAFTGSKAKRFGLYHFSLGLILAGGIGNLIDRLSFGYVIDFLDLRIWPVFNIADSAITIGAVLLGYLLLFKPPCE